MSTAHDYSAKLLDAQSTGHRAALCEVAGSFDDALPLYISAAQSYLYLMRHTTNAVEKARLRALSMKLVDRAERIKKAKKVRPVLKDRMCAEEQDLVLEMSGTVEGVQYPRWTARDSSPPMASTSTAQPELSPVQIEADVKWSSASTALPNAVMISPTGKGEDIVQGNVADCSFVAALLVGVDHHSRFGSKLSFGSLYPQDERGFPVKSPTKRHNGRFLVNGTWRRISIDDALPVTEDGRLFCASTLQRDQLWPSLIEKTYMSLMGGYNFKGSNSSTDLYALTGWIPEHVSLNVAGYRSDKTWDRVFQGFEEGHCLVTIGTGKASSVDFGVAGLVPTHNYAVVNLREVEGRRLFDLRDPWQKQPTGPWGTEEMRAALEEDPSKALTFDWAEMALNFDSLYLNWNPERFSQTDVVHCAMKKATSSIQSTPQSTLFRLRVEPSSTPSEVWILLSRHHQQQDDTNDFVGLSVNRSWSTGGDMASSTPGDTASTLVNTPHTLYRFNTDIGTSLYDMFISYRGTSAQPRFSLRALANVAIKIEDGPKPFPYSSLISGKWSERTAGGNHTYHTFMNNPQYSIKISPLPGQTSLLADLSITCETTKELSVNIKVVRSDGGRVAEYEERDVIGGASQYSYGMASIRTREVQPATYTLIVSTFSPNQEGDFQLTIESNLPLEVATIPQEGAGMFSRSVRGVWSSRASPAPSYHLAVPKTTNIKARLQTKDTGAIPIALSVYTIEQDPTPPRLVYTTGPFSDATCGVVTSLIKLPSSDLGYTIVPTTFLQDFQANYQLLLYADSPVILTQSSAT